MMVDAAADGDDERRNGDAIAVLMTVRRLMDGLDGSHDWTDGWMATKTG